MCVFVYIYTHIYRSYIYIYKVLYMCLKSAEKLYYYKYLGYIYIIRIFMLNICNNKVFLYFSSASQN